MHAYSDMWCRRGASRLHGSEEERDAPGRGIPTYVWVAGLVLSTVVCTGVLSPMLRMPVFQPIAAVAIALLVAVLAVRALGETDLVLSSLTRISAIC